MYILYIMNIKLYFLLTLLIVKVNKIFTNNIENMLFLNKKIINNDIKGYDMRNIVDIKKVDIKDINEYINKNRLCKLLNDKNIDIYTKIEYINKEYVFDNSKLPNIKKGGLMKDWDFEM